MPTYEVRKYSDIAAVIRQVRESAGLSQSDVAERLGFTRFYVQDLETGERPPVFVQRMFRLLRLLRITITVSFDPGDDDDRR